MSLRLRWLSGVGALIGGIAGGGSGAAKGAAVGAAVGLTITFSTRGEDIKLAPGSVFTLTVNSTAAGKNDQMPANGKHELRCYFVDFVSRGFYLTVNSAHSDDVFSWCQLQDFVKGFGI